MQVISIFLKKRTVAICNITLFLALLQLSSYTTVAQSLCRQKLEAANASYKLGRFREVTDSLEVCFSGIDGGFDNLQDKVDAYRLIILSYIFDNQLSLAHKNIRRLLKEYPSFRIYDNDPPELKYLFHSYRNLPAFSVYLSVRPSYVLPNLLQDFQISTLASQEKVNYQNSFAVGFTTGFYYYLWRGIFINGGITYQSTPISQNASISFSQMSTQDNARGKPLITSNYLETQQNLEFPLSLNWILFTYNRQKNLRKIIPYIGIGVILKQQLNAELFFERKQDNGNISIENTLDIKSLRRNTNYDALGQLGIQFKTALRLSVSIFASYRVGIFSESIGDNYFPSNFNKSQNTEDLSVLTYDAAYTNNHFSTNQLSISLQLHYLFYNPKRTKK